jgi:hypothetical protein
MSLVEYETCLNGQGEDIVMAFANRSSRIKNVKIDLMGVANIENHG